MAFAAHRYSQNKISSWRSSKVEFGKALGALSEALQPVANQTTSARTLNTQTSIKQETHDVLGASAARDGDPETRFPRSVDVPTETDDDEAIDDEEIGVHLLGIPDFNQYSWSPRKPFGNKNTNLRQLSDGHTIDHRARLSDSLSDNHILEEPLIPLPLRIKNPCPPMTDMSTCTPRPLPPLPFNHKPSIFRHGESRLVQRPTSNIKTPQPLKKVNYSANKATPSSFTPRFDFIYDVFEPQQSPLQPGTRNSSGQSQPAKQDLPLTNQDELASHMNDFCRQIQTYHIPLIDHQISDAVQTQHEHEEQKRQQGTSRVASYWLLRPVSPTSRVVPEAAITRRREPKRMLRHTMEASQEDETDEQQTIMRQERVEKLRKNGWNVRKERHGFKGVGYYEKLENDVLSELVNA